MVFIRMQGDGSASAAAIGALDAVFNPAAARAREDWESQNERVVAVPSPGDRLLADGVVVITRTTPDPDPAPDPTPDPHGPA